MIPISIASILLKHAGFRDPRQLPMAMKHSLFPPPDRQTPEQSLADSYLMLWRRLSGVCVRRNWEWESRLKGQPEIKPHENRDTELCSHGKSIQFHLILPAMAYGIWATLNASPCRLMYGIFGSGFYFLPFIYTFVCMQNWPNYVCTANANTHTHTWA